MARPQSQRKGGMRLGNPLMAQGEAPGVFARPISRAVGEDRSVSEFISAMGQFAKVADVVNDRFERREMIAGEAARKAGVSRKEDASAAWAEGYQRADAALAGDEDGEGLIQGFLSGQDVGMNPEGFIQQVYSLKTRGMPDGPFKSAYDTSFAAKAEKFRALFKDRQREQVIAKAEENAAKLIDRTFHEYASVPDPDDLQPGADETDEQFALRLRDAASTRRFPSAEELAALFDHAKNVGISGRRFNEMLLATANTYGNMGIATVYEALKQPRADGTPPLYAIPEFKRAIDEGEMQAFRVQASQQRQRQLALKDERERARDVALSPIYLRAFAKEDPNGARDELNALMLKNPGLFSPTEIHTHTQRITRQAALEETAENKKLWHDLYIGIYNGTTKHSSILTAELPGKMKAELLEKWDSYVARMVTLNDRSREAVERWRKSAEPTSAYDTVDVLDRGIQNSFDFDGEFKNRAAIAKAQSLAIIRTAIEEASFIADPAKRSAQLSAAQKIAITNFNAQLDPYRANPGTKPPSITSKSRADALRRYKAGEINDKQLRLERDYFNRNPNHETK